MRLNCFLKISENFSGPKQFVKLNPVDLKSPTLKYVFKSSQNMIILKLVTLTVVLPKIKRNFCHSRSTGKVSGVSCSGLFISLLIAVLPWNECLIVTSPIIV